MERTENLSQVMVDAARCRKGLGITGSGEPPTGLSMSSLQPLHAIGITAVVLGVNFVIGQPVSVFEQ